MSASAIEPKPGIDMGRVVVPITVSNVEDVRRSELGQISAADVRSMTVDALVDSGATFLCMPISLIQQLGLPFNRKRGSRVTNPIHRQRVMNPIHTVTGTLTLDVFGGIRLRVGGRECDEEVMALPEGRQVLLGQIPLEKLDFWIDLNGRKLVGNPEHDGQWLADVF